MLFHGIEEEAITALADVIEARLARGLPGFKKLEVGDWFGYGEISKRALRACLPSLCALQCGAIDRLRQRAIDAMAETLSFCPAPQLRTLSLRSSDYVDISALISTLRQTVFSTLKHITLDAFTFTPTALQNLVHALQQSLASLESLTLTDCIYLDQEGPETLVGAFEQGAGACLRTLIIQGRHGDYSSVDARLAAAIAAGVCPVLEEVECGEGAAAKAALEARRQG